jgi:hypothetical protein
MRTTARAARLVQMGYLTHLGIYLEPDATPIAGYITTEREKWRPFHGWLELSSAIETQRTAGPRPADASGRAGAPRISSLGTEFPQAPCPRAAASETRRGDSGAAGEHHRIATWLAQRNQPTWMLLGAWTCACWNAIAVVAFATIGDTRFLAWWGLGLVATVVLLTFIWTEQRSSLDSGDGDQPRPGGPPTRPQGAGSGNERHQRRSHVLEQGATPLGHTSAPHRRR